MLVLVPKQPGFFLLHSLHSESLVPLTAPVTALVDTYVCFSLMNVSFPNYTISFIRAGLSQCLGFFLFLFCVPSAWHIVCAK